jgi:hypothetical protein
MTLLPNLQNGQLLEWADKLTVEGLCDKLAPKLRELLLDPIKVKVFALELIVVGHCGAALKVRNTSMEGDEFEFITAYSTITHLSDAVRPTAVEDMLMPALQELAIANGADSCDLQRGRGVGVAPTSRLNTPAPISRDDVPRILKALPAAQLKTANISIDASFWDWGDDTPPQPRYFGKPTSWACQDDGAEAIRIKWEKGRDDAGNPQEGYASTELATFENLLQPSCGLRLEPFDDGSCPSWSATSEPAPQPSDEEESEEDLLSSTDFRRKEVLVARAKAMIAPALEYYEKTIEGKRGEQLSRMKAVRFLDPLYVQANGDVTEAEINGLSIFRMSKHPKLVAAIKVCPQPACLPVPVPMPALTFHASLSCCRR